MAGCDLFNGPAASTGFSHSGPLGRILNADVHDVGRLARSKIFLTIIEGKRLEDKTLYEFMPQAISQAAALCEATRYFLSPHRPRTLTIVFRSTAVRFCLADGRKWIFSVFAKDDRGATVCYEGNVVSILEPRFDAEGRDTAWEQSIHQVVEIVYHWVCVISARGSLLTQMMTASYRGTSSGGRALSAGGPMHGKICCYIFLIVYIYGARIQFDAEVAIHS